MQKIAILYDASQAVISTFDLDEVLNHIVQIVQDYFHLHRVAIFLADHESGALSLRTHAGWGESDLPLQIGLGKGLIGSSAQLKRPIYAPDVSKDPRYLDAIRSTRSELAIPLIVRDEVVGVLDCQSDQLDFFDSEASDLLILFSTQASIALQNARLYSLEQRKAAQLEAINYIAKQATAVLDLGELLGKVCQLLLQSFSVDHVSVLLREENSLVVKAHHGRLTPAIPEGAAIPAHMGLAARAIESRTTVVENDVSAAPDYVVGFKETRSEVCIPLVSLGELIGVLALESSRKDAFEKADIAPLESVADISANAIQNAHYFERVRQMAYVDGLTGMFNRRYFEIRIVEELERAQRYHGSMAVIMLDIDKFKALNDEFGHLLGDEVLRQVATVFSSQLRKADTACRYGGEEFAIIVPETTGEHALAVAEKLRQVIANWHFPGVSRNVTVTGGVASYPQNGTTRDDLVRAADEALYAGKQAGRNRILPATTRA